MAMADSSILYIRRYRLVTQEPFWPLTCFSGSWQYIWHPCVNSRKVPWSLADTTFTQVLLKCRTWWEKLGWILPSTHPIPSWRSLKSGRDVQSYTVALGIKKIISRFQDSSSYSLYGRWSQETPARDTREEKERRQGPWSNLLVMVLSPGEKSGKHCRTQASELSQPGEEELGHLFTKSYQLLRPAPETLIPWQFQSLHTDHRDIQCFQRNPQSQRCCYWQVGT